MSNQLLHFLIRNSDFRPIPRAQAESECRPRCQAHRLSEGNASRPTGSAPPRFPRHYRQPQEHQAHGWPGLPDAHESTLPLTAVRRGSPARTLQLRSVGASPERVSPRRRPGSGRMMSRSTTGVGDPRKELIQHHFAAITDSGVTDGCPFWRSWTPLAANRARDRSWRCCTLSPHRHADHVITSTLNIPTPDKTAFIWPLARPATEADAWAAIRTVREGEAFHRYRAFTVHRFGRLPLFDARDPNRGFPKIELSAVPTLNVADARRTLEADRFLGWARVLRAVAAGYLFWDDDVRWTLASGLLVQGWSGSDRELYDSVIIATS